MSNDASAVEVLDRSGDRLLFYCPGCKGTHGIPASSDPTKVGPKVWGWNGSMVKPTFTPSILVQGSKFTDKGEKDYQAWRAGDHSVPGGKFDSIPTRCHSFIRDGNIEFCLDCTHELKGQTVPLIRNPHVHL